LFNFFELLLFKIGFNWKLAQGHRTLHLTQVIHKPSLHSTPIQLRIAIGVDFFYYNGALSAVVHGVQLYLLVRVRQGLLVKWGRSNYNGVYRLIVSYLLHDSRLQRGWLSLLSLDFHYRGCL
jgi:hypothetical protein